MSVMWIFSLDDNFQKEDKDEINILEEKEDQKNVKIELINKKDSDRINWWITKMNRSESRQFIMVELNVVLMIPHLIDFH